MSTLADPQVVELCRERLRRLAPDARAKWGRMTAHQMVCHLNDSFRVGMGEKYASPASSFLQRTLVKWIALHTSLRWPHGVPTRPEVEQGVGGTAPVDWDRDCAALDSLMKLFSQHPAFGAHPTFSTMSGHDWLIWGYRHVDHHFRQFGV